MRRRTTLGALLAALPLAAGCGIQGSDVVEAGGAPTVVVQPIPESRMLLYFLGPHGEPMPVSRDTGLTFVPLPEKTLPEGGSGADDASTEGTGRSFESSDDDPPYGSAPATMKVLSALLAGPGGAEFQAGITTELPQSDELIRVESELAGGIRLRTPFPARELSPGAVVQLVCTAAHAVDRAGALPVTVTGPDGALPATTCAAAAG
ncbi:hypothetical protein AB0M64_02535 [Streptomyces sp. NPDC051771]|uniref:hypothetical protein n=1 Tax=Streptomyces sp. NPDC051771 TaxID=3154847 RepID=UPI00342219A0